MCTRNLGDSSEYKVNYLDSGSDCINRKIWPKTKELCKSRNEEREEKFELFAISMLVNNFGYFVHKILVGTNINCCWYERGWE